MNKTPHFKLYLKLKQQECVIDKSIETFLVSCKVDTEVCHNIKRAIDQFDQDRKQIVESFNEAATNIYRELKAARATVREQKVEKIDVEDLKRRLQSLWSRIEEFKKSCNCVDALKAEQSNLEVDLNALERSIRKHKNFSSAGSLHCKSSSLKNQTLKDESVKECDYDDVEDFCTLLAKTGHTGNWSEEDHLFFVRARKKQKGIAALVGAIQARCPDLDKESVVNHEAWYKKYLSLREQQRLAVKDWRQRREAERLERRRGVADVPATKPLLVLVKNNSKDDEEQAEEQERKRETLRRWREERNKARTAQQERARSAERAKLESAESRRRTRDAEIKRILAERRERSDQDQERVARETEQYSKPAGNSFILQLYRARDQEYLEKRKSMLMSNSVQSKLLLQPLQCNVYKNNESTLFKETKAWQDKVRSDEVKSFNTISYIKDLPKRTIATWRSFEIPS